MLTEGSPPKSVIKDFADSDSGRERENEEESEKKGYVLPFTSKRTEKSENAVLLVLNMEEGAHKQRTLSDSWRLKREENMLPLEEPCHKLSRPVNSNIQI